MNPSLVQKIPVTAAQIYQPGFADILQMNESVSARHFRRFQHDRVSGDSSKRTTTMDRMAFAIGRFNPGTFLWGCAHAGTFYQKVMLNAKCLRWRSELLRARANPEQASQGLRPPALKFLPTLNNV